MATTRWPGRRSAGAALAGLAMAAGVLVAPPAVHAATARTCGPVTLGPTLDPRPAMTTVAGGAVAGPAHASPALDMDGDEAADVVTWPTPTTVSVARGDGVLTLEDVPPDPPYPGYPAAHGSRLVGDDLDGDGRDELVWTRWSVPGFGQPPSFETWIVRGTAAPDTVSLPDLALSIRGDLSADIDDDGLDDLQLEGPTIAGVRVPSRWVSAARALDGPDPTAIAPSAPRLGAVLDLDLDGVDDRVVVGSADRTDGGRIELSLGGQIALDLSSLPLYVQPMAAWIGPTYLAFEPGGVREVRATCARAWMADAAPLVLGRAPLAADYPTFGPGEAADRVERLERTQTMVRSQTARGHLVDQTFLAYLDRPADPAGRAWWVRQLRAGTRTPERLLAETLGSAERWRRAGADATAWVDATYPKAFGRAADPGGRAYWARQVATVGPGRTAARMLASREARRFLVVRYARQAQAFGPEVPSIVRERGEQTLAELGFDRFLAALAASPELYLLANHRNVLATP